MQMSPLHILITGAHGLIGNLLYQHLAAQPARYQVYGLDRSAEPSTRILATHFMPVPPERFIQADLGDFAAILPACQGMDCVVHLAADPDGRTWQSVRDNNLVGTYHVFEACRQTGVQRVIFASTVMVNFGYPPDETYGAILHNSLPKKPALKMNDLPSLTHRDATRPSTLYAASKVWGEALAHAFSYQYGMHCLCVRIGWVVGDDRPPPRYSGAVWLSHRDCVNFFQKCIEASASAQFDIFYAISNNRYRFQDLEHARQVLGYIPQDSDAQFIPLEET